MTTALENAEKKLARITATLEEIWKEEPGVHLRYRDSKTQATVLSLQGQARGLLRFIRDSKATPCGDPH